MFFFIKVVATELHIFKICAVMPPYSCIRYSVSKPKLNIIFITNFLIQHSCAAASRSSIPHKLHQSVSTSILLLSQQQHLTLFSFSFCIPTLPKRKWCQNVNPFTKVAKKERENIERIYIFAEEHNLIHHHLTNASYVNKEVSCIS